MKMIGQNAALASLETSLVPDPSLIDGRTETERLSFLSEFAALINFYDQTNSINGNWRPFLLKDPVFLLAHISTTDYRRLYQVYVNTCANLEKNISTNSSEGTTILFNLLFDQLTDIFIRIERWTYYMQMNSEEYDLRRYVLTQVKETYSSMLWAMLSLRNYLSSERIAGRVKPVHAYVYDIFDGDLWTKYSTKNPYQDVLNIEFPDKKKETATAESGTNEHYTNAERLAIYFEALSNAGDSLFRFFHTIVRHASTEYEKVKEKKSSYPDTTLLRAFTELMKTHQEQLNGISEKHLRFYYRDILKQSEQTAVADSVFICTVLGKNAPVFELPAQTAFNAGTDAQKQPVVFSSLSDVSLNAASVASAHTLSYVSNSFSHYENAAPSVLAKDESGALQTWQTFGAPAAAATLGFAFGSPMLLLLEGDRAITVTMNFAVPVDTSMFLHASYALSTQKAWLNVKPEGLTQKQTPQQEITFTITLSAADPAIEPFAKSPDNLNSDLPMLQVLFTTFTALDSPPDVTALTIAVTVQDMTSVQLCNDYGSLSTKTPFQIFGPIPGANSNFMIGSAEIFSKPITSLIIELDWDNLPFPPSILDFSKYYEAYNTYLGPHGFIGSDAVAAQTQAKNTALAATESKLKTFAETAGATLLKSPSWIIHTAAHIPLAAVLLSFIGLWKLGKGAAAVVKNAAAAIRQALAKKAESVHIPGAGGSPFAATTGSAALPLPYYNNSTFVVAFSLLESHAWTSLPTDVETGTSTVPAAPQTLFSPAQPFGPLSGATLFSFTAPAGTTLYNGDPSLQNDLSAPLAYSSSSSSGFLRMTLNSPSYGFGASVYPAVVASVALQNALKISHDTDHTLTPADLLPSANVPFAPKATAAKVTYTAAQTYSLQASAPTGNYPLQWFYYTPFTNYTACDTTSGAPAVTVLNTFAGDAVPASGLLLFPAMKYKGVLYIELKDLVPDNYINLFFELAATYGSTSEIAPPDYFYLTAAGWEKMNLIADGTNMFSCPGIVEVNVPGDISNQTAWRAGENCWLAIGVTSDPSVYSQTVLLATNGIQLQRSGSNYLTDTAAPKLVAGVISKPVNAVPQIATITQPFPSFGGKPAEDQIQMNQRVSNRIKTKNRAVSREDFFRMITEAFPEIYYTKAVFNADSNTVNVFVVKKYDSVTDANAFIPLVSTCDEEHILDFLKDKRSVFPSIAVSDFDFCTVTVNAAVTMTPGYASQAVQDNVIAALKVYLSPWITSTVEQVAIDEGVSEAAIAAFINTVEGVQSVSAVTLSFSPQPAEAVAKAGMPQPGIIRADAGQLFVTASKHIITTVAA
jgi:hypothetical protein